MTTRTADHTLTPTRRVIDAVAAESDVDPTALTPPLGTVIDPDALNQLLDRDEHSDAVVSFEYAGYLVTVGNDDLSLEPLSEA